MKIELTKEDRNNVYVALVHLAKSNQVEANGMKALLNLSDKFVVEEKAVEGEVVEKKV